MANESVKIVVVVYNRLHNLKHWLHCWQQSDTAGAELIVIHNTDVGAPEYLEVCQNYNARYIQRQNKGFDIGCFQDVCKGRMPGFPAWERLLWITDDTFPMAKDFIRQFEKAMKPGIGVACMQISASVRRHIRTTGFMIDRSTASRLQWEVDPIISKEDCYRFEHRHPKITFLDQVEKMGLRVTQVAHNSVSPLWDTGYKKKLNRQAAHNRIFGQRPNGYMVQSVKQNDHPGVTFICPIYNGYPLIVASLIQQTYANWKLILIHDGPGEIKDLPTDERITVIYSAERKGFWGHSHRAEYLQKVDTEFVVITNNDNYHVPVYVEYLQRAFKRDTVAAYCSDMVHSYKAWQIIPCSLKRGYLDCAGVMLRTKEAQAVGWRDVTSHSADWFFFESLIRKYGEHRFVRVNGCLLIHN